MNTLSGNGLTIGQPLMPNYQLTIRQGDGGSPYTAPPKEKTGPFVPAPKRDTASTPQDSPRLPNIPFYNNYDEAGGNNQMFIRDQQMEDEGKQRFKDLTGIDLANLVDGMPDPSIMNYVTEQGFFLDGQGRAYMQGGGKFQDAGEYNPDIHGLPVPLAQQMQINPDLAMEYDPGDAGGVVIPQDFSPLPFRYFQHLRTPAIRQQELDHFNNFIESMGGGLDRVQRMTPMSIASHDNRQFKSVPAVGPRGDTPASKEYIDGMLQRKIKPSTPNNLFGLA